MAGRLTISTLNNDTGVLATQNGMTGIAKAWVNFNGTGTVAIRDSFNVSSITDNGTGDYTVNFTTAMPNANYAFLSTTEGFVVASENNNNILRTTTQIRMNTVAISGVTVVDRVIVSVAIFSS